MDLIKIKEKIEKAKTQHAEIGGELKSIEDQIKNEFKIEIEDSKKYLEELNLLILEKEKKFEQNTENLKNSLSEIPVFDGLL